MKAGDDGHGHYATKIRDFCAAGAHNAANHGLVICIDQSIYASDRICRDVSLPGVRPREIICYETAIERLLRHRPTKIISRREASSFRATGR